MDDAEMDGAEPALPEPKQQTGDQRFLLLADAAPFFIWMAGPDAQCTYANRAWLELRGRTLSEEAGNGWIEGLHPDDRDLCLEIFLKSFSARQPFHMTGRVLRVTGEYAWVEGAGTPYFAEDSSFLGFLGSGVDITERKRAIFTPDMDAVRVVCALTERERQVLVLIADGRSTKEAASTLGISYKTADSHRSRILEKLGVHETASMVRYAIRAGLISP
jgi:PAS domain S-box-containing protein